MFNDGDTDLEELENDGASQEAIILVVGGSSRDADGVLVDNGASVCKARVADALAEGRGASNIRKTEGGVRIFSKVSLEDDPRGDPAVIDSTPLVVENHWNFVQNARAWVSLNSLKRLSGKLVLVVCVVTSSGINDPVHKEPDFSGKTFTWLHLLAYIFQGHQLAIMMLVKIEGTDRSDVTKSGIKLALQRGGFARSNISFFGIETLPDTVRLALGHSLFHGTSRNNWNPMAPICLNTVTSNATEVDAYGPWGPDRVILFGPEASGKSTLAQMLTLGRLDPDSQNFLVGSGFSVAGSSKRSTTRGCQRGEGRGWYVANTPGLIEMVGETQRNVLISEMSDNDLSIIPGGTEGTLEKTLREFARLLRVDTGGAAKSRLGETIKEFAREAEGVYTHVIYLWMKDRMDVRHWKLWRIFLQSFLHSKVNSTLSIVISGAEQPWVEENISYLQQVFEGCGNIFSAEFPPVSVDDVEVEEEYQLMRLYSLKDLEYRLADLSSLPSLFSSESFSKEESRARKVNNLVTRAAMESLESLHSLRAGVGVQNIEDSSRRSSSWCPSHRYI